MQLIILDFSSYLSYEEIAQSDHKFLSDKLTEPIQGNAFLPHSHFSNINALKEITHKKFRYLLEHGGISSESYNSSIQNNLI
jgi:hypothetical protein